MIRLVAPDPRRYEAWAAVLEDFASGAKDGSGILEDAPSPTRALFATYLADRAAEEDRTTPPPPGRVPCHSRWIVDESWESGGEILGFLATRLVLNPFLFEKGGHVGYSVRPGARGRGVARAALDLAVLEARSLGIDPVLVTCVEENLASRRVIEGAGGVFEDSRDGFRRYWIGGGARPDGPEVP